MSPKRTIDSHAPVLVIGLGRFGAALALELTARGQEVMAVDRDPVLVQKYSPALTHVVQADTTDPEALEQLGAAEFDIAVCGIGTSIEASVLTTVNLVELGIDKVLAKAVTPSHRTILERIGASRVILPEQDAGERTAHLLTGTMMEFIEFRGGWAIAQMQAPERITHKPLVDVKTRSRYGVTIVAYRRNSGTYTTALPETVLRTRDELIVAGPIEDLENFADRS
ncbi:MULTISPECIES: potassium channel family protein [Auritidibacter]|uniref:TrkA family potassium uptake protein n=1 Tax=Auritidibacter ignavus TaxID=678932 RepID=A0AAJ6ANK7_9MICC|nr:MULTISPECIES: TrkA family potassium uptake protein [Auritidibacter]PXA78049.1 potassium transporter [Auritidibacter sp. NML120779]NIH71328.1 trk system potassium uptake protein TrkA [Auritidibacter ignavus]PXA78255.1 potassium transporter [Auritidibacter sp. NML100628]PXA81020.1 potassium transporter [Auritidibacter sp. NML120636]RMX23498.1 TrkA family potassium uptake protein [Auritidibacter ignavus]